MKVKGFVIEGKNNLIHAMDSIYGNRMFSTFEKADNYAKDKDTGYMLDEYKVVNREIEIDEELLRVKA